MTNEIQSLFRKQIDNASSYLGRIAALFAPVTIMYSLGNLHALPDNIKSLMNIQDFLSFYTSIVYDLAEFTASLMYFVFIVPYMLSYLIIRGRVNRFIRCVLSTFHLIVIFYFICVQALLIYKLIYEDGYKRLASPLLAVGVQIETISLFTIPTLILIAQRIKREKYPRLDRFFYFFESRFIYILLAVVMPVAFWLGDSNSKDFLLGMGRPMVTIKSCNERLPGEGHVLINLTSGVIYGKDNEYYYVTSNCLSSISITKNK